MQDRQVYGLDDFQLEQIELIFSNEISARIVFSQNEKGQWFWNRAMMRKGAVDWDYTSVKQFKKLRQCVNHALKHLRLCTEEQV